MTRDCFLILFLASASACTGKDSDGGPPGSENGNVIEGQNGTAGQNDGEQADDGSQNASPTGNGSTTRNGTTGSGTTGSGTTGSGTTGSGTTGGGTTGNDTTGNDTTGSGTTGGGTTGSGTTGNGTTGSGSGPGFEPCQAMPAADHPLARANLNAQLVDGSTALVNVTLKTCPGVAGDQLVIEGTDPAIFLQLPVVIEDAGEMTVLGLAPHAPKAVPSATFTQRYGELPVDVAGYTHLGFDAYASLDMDPPYLRIVVTGYADGECDQCTADGCSQCDGWEGGTDLLKVQETPPGL